MGCKFFMRLIFKLTEQSMERNGSKPAIQAESEVYIMWKILQKTKPYSAEDLKL